MYQTHANEKMNCFLPRTKNPSTKIASLHYFYTKTEELSSISYFQIYWQTSY